MKSSRVPHLGRWLGIDPQRAKSSTRLRVALAALVILVGSASLVLAQNLNVNSGSEVSSTLGTASLTTCSSAPVLTLVPVVTAGVERIGEVAVDNIPIECAGKNLVVEFLSDDNEVLDRIVWSLSLRSENDTSISARANGTTVATANTSESNVSVIYPVFETGASGLDSANLSPSAIVQFTVQASITAVSE
jgi:hypothetical protein